MCIRIGVYLFLFIRPIRYGGYWNSSIILVYYNLFYLCGGMKTTKWFVCQRICCVCFEDGWVLNEASRLHIQSQWLRQHSYSNTTDARVLACCVWLVPFFFFSISFSIDDYRRHRTGKQSVCVTFVYNLPIAIYSIIANWIIDSVLERFQLFLDLWFDFDYSYINIFICINFSIALASMFMPVWLCILWAHRLFLKNDSKRHTMFVCLFLNLVSIVNLVNVVYVADCFVFRLC